MDIPHNRAIQFGFGDAVDVSFSDSRTLLSLIPYNLADWWVRLLPRGFLLVVYNVIALKRIFLNSGHEIERRSDGRTSASLNFALWRRHDNNRRVRTAQHDRPRG